MTEPTVGEYMKQLEHSPTAEMVWPLWKTLWQLLIKLINTHITYDTTISLSHRDVRDATVFFHFSSPLLQTATWCSHRAVQTFVE